jgi:nucleoside-diphosphate-sugar epimerase
LHDELFLCVTGNEQKTAHLWALPGAKERLELVKADLLTAGSYDEAVSGCDGVFHTATAVVLIESDPQSEMIDPAVFGTLNVLRSCKKSRSVKRVVMTSSSAAVRFNSIFPSAAIPLDETVWSSVPLCTQYKLRIKID